MKYDSGMTSFNKDIIAVLRYMLKDDKEITEKFSPEDGSPAPLREYLKQKYGKINASHIGDGMRYSCNVTKGIELVFDTILNNPGDKNLTLSWSQTAKFIRDNWDEVFKKSESASPQTETVLPKVGDYVEEDMLGDLLSFDELTEMIGQLVVNDYSTESKNWYKVVRIDKIHTNDVDGSRSVAVIDGPKKNDIGWIGEYAFNALGTHTLGGKAVLRAHRMWRLKQEPAKNQPSPQLSYIEKLREEYPKVNETDKWFDTVYCPYELFDGDGVNAPDDDKCDYSVNDEACQKCWRDTCPPNIFFAENKDFEEEYFENYPEDEADEQTDRENVSNEKNAPESKPTYKDIFLEHYPNFDVSRFDEFAESLCVACCFDDDGAECPYGAFSGECKKHWEDKCLFEWRGGIECNLETINEFLIEQPSENEIAESTAETAVAVQDESTEVQAAFDYSELDGDTAKNLRECETVIRQETAGYFTLLGAKFKEAQDLLANHANGTFEKWYTAMGFKRQTVYNLIQRYDFLGSPTIGGREDTFEALPLTLSYEVSKPDAPAELVEKVLDGDITTNAEYIALKKQLEKANEQISILHSTIEKKDGEIDGARGCIETLEKEIDELESRPVDVAVQQDTELLEELEELREENARLKDDSVKSMVIRLTLDEYDKLLEKLGGDPCLGHIIKHAKIIKL